MVAVDRHLTLQQFVDARYVGKVNNFDYAGIPGVAEVIGYHIIFFTVKGKDGLSAISMEELEGNALFTEIANKILAAIHCDVAIGEKREHVKKLWGEPDFKDDVFTGIERCYYLKKGVLLVAGFNRYQKGVSLECVMDEELIKNRISIFS
ncbi:hypothetical protein SAMN05421788_108229 [Filimonas lacunae]|uniref:Uncharacterized protein n=1 Tax=Filimonas lacunae TaxID=477680 RepID=A0A173MDI5_9BACT|nr:hypothetical protein [Filimonas lacunae]BAV05625.1 hypothetical protein FLA_1636 [Filimonas lacunae]SIT29146.1 hypothetical protein SAMN05421788_108229 [Filimonas lacunae]